MPAQKPNQPEPAPIAFRPARSVVAVAVGLAIFGWSGMAHSAGLGRLTVQSALGQPLQAEVEVTSVGRDEAPTLSARLASPEQFRTAGLQYNNALSGLQMAVEERGGRHFIRVSSSAPVNEPFVDLLVELNWASGRFVREYTFLLDPPELRASRQTVESSTAAAAPVLPAVAASASEPSTGSAVEAATAAAAAAGASQARNQAQPAPSARTGTGASRDPAEVAREILAQRDASAAAAAARSPAPRPPAATADTTRALTRPAEAPAAPASASSPSTVTVARGETLGQIAARVRPANATLEQTIVAIYQANESAFINGNPNLVLEGRTLEIPDAERISAVDASTATRTLHMAARDFRAYKERLAGSPTEVQTSDRTGGTTASGSVTGQVQDRAESTAPDRLELSRSAGNDGANQAVGTRDAEAEVAREAALKEANSRVSQLERNVADLQKMLELRNKTLSDLQGQIEQMRASGATVSGSVAASAATAASQAQVEANKVAEAAKAETAKLAAAKADAAKVEAAKADAAKADLAKADAAKAEAARVEAAKAEAAKADAAKAEAAKVEAAKVDAAKAEAARVEAAKTEAAKADAAKAEAAKVEAAKADAAKVEAAKVEADAAAKAAADKAEADRLAAAAAVAAGATQPADPVAGAQPAQPARPVATVEPPAPEASFVDGMLGNPLMLAGIAGLALLGAGWAWLAMRRRKEERFEDSLVAADAFTSNSLFGTTGGQSVDTTTNTGMSTQITTMSEASPTEVDPIAEADVYIAYGREAQAEEILKEALKRQLDRQAIRLKLLEIYSGRKDTHSFEQLAREMYDMTGGQNEEWSRVASMGASLDPANPLYTASVAGDSPYADLDTPASASSRVDEPKGSSAGFGPVAAAGLGAAAGFAAGSARAEESDPETFTDSVPSFEASRIDPPTAIQPDDGSLEFEPTGFANPDDAAKARKEFDDALDFASSRSGPPSLLPQVDMPSLDLDSTDAGELRADAGLDAPSLESATTQTGPRTLTGAAGAEMDLSSIGLDLDLDRPTRSGPATMTGAGSGQWQEMASKLDLASAYGEIGDKEGARELLQEVLRGGDPTQQQKAKDMLARI